MSQTSIQQTNKVTREIPQKNIPNTYNSQSNFIFNSMLCLFFQLVCQKTNILYNTVRIHMQKQVILLMESDQYPFGEFQHNAQMQHNQKTHPLSISQRSLNTQTKIRVLVRKIFPTRSLQQRNELLQKIGIIRNLEHPNIIRIESVLEQENGIHILMEYVPYKMVDMLKKNKKDGYESIARAIYDLQRNLREEGIGIQWNIGYIGLTDTHQSKYYVNVDKMIIESDLFKLRKKNQKQTALILEQLHRIVYPISNLKQRQNQNKHRKGSSIQLHCDPLNLQKFDPESSYNSNNTKSRQSLQAKTPSQRMRVNWREIEQNQEILNDFINVLEDQDDQPDDADQNQIQKGIEEEEQLEMKHQEMSRNPKVVGPSMLNSVEEMEEVVWQNHDNLKDQVDAAIQRSRRVMEVFRSVTGIRR